MRTSIVTFALLAAMGAGCAVDEHTDTSGGTTVDTPPDRTLNVQLAVVDATGAPVELNHFDAPEDVYLTVRPADPGQPVVAEDFVYSVIDSTGAVLSTDDPSCRQFHVDERGTIASVKQMCLHKIAAGLLIGVAPFRNATRMTLEVAAVSDGESLSVPFVVQ